MKYTKDVKELFLNTPTDRAQRIDERNVVIFLFIMFSPRLYY